MRTCFVCWQGLLWTTHPNRRAQMRSRPACDGGGFTHKQVRACRHVRRIHVQKPVLNVCVFARTCADSVCVICERSLGSAGMMMPQPQGKGLWGRNGYTARPRSLSQDYCYTCLCMYTRVGTIACMYVGVSRLPSTRAQACMMDGEIDRRVQFL